MPDEPTTYILRIMEGTRCVAEAPLIIYEPEVAMRNFMETLPSAIAMMAGAVVGAMQNACLAQPPLPGFVGLAMQGNHSGLQLASELPRNGHSPKV